LIKVSFVALGQRERTEHGMSECAQPVHRVTQ
jgi:hypothetical protein